jgi:hypothetical protein
MRINLTMPLKRGERGAHRGKTNAQQKEEPAHGTDKISGGSRRAFTSRVNFKTPESVFTLRSPRAPRFNSEIRSMSILFILPTMRNVAGAAVDDRRWSDKGSGRARRFYFSKARRAEAAATASRVSP